jgi:hypothetical protein
MKNQPSRDVRIIMDSRPSIPREIAEMINTEVQAIRLPMPELPNDIVNMIMCFNYTGWAEHRNITIPFAEPTPVFRGFM